MPPVTVQQAIQIAIGGNARAFRKRVLTPTGPWRFSPGCQR